MQDINHAVSGFKDHFAVFNESEIIVVLSCVI